MKPLGDTANCEVIDLIDAAFLARMARPVGVEMPTRPERAAARAGPSRPAPLSSPPDRSPVLVSLLQRAPDQWRRVADIVERAFRRGRRVIAVAGGAKGEGRTTLVDGIVATLTGRGVAVARVNRAELLHAVGRGAETVTLVDAGIWFPPGPIRMASLSALAQGCDAAILVRRAAEAPCPARGAALGRIGIECLGELETFATP